MKKSVECFCAYSSARASVVGQATQQRLRTKSGRKWQKTNTDDGSRT